MEISEFRKRINSIIDDKSRSLSHRAFDALQLMTDVRPEEVGEMDVFVFSSLLEMMKDECHDHSCDGYILELVTLLAEAYSELDDYRPVEALALDAIKLLRGNKVSMEAVTEYIPRIAAVLEDSVFYHALYEILLLYIPLIISQRPEDEYLRPLSTILLKLKHLIKDAPELEKLWTPGLEKDIESLLSPEELERIESRPDLGRLRKDPVEYTRKWEALYFDLEDELEEILRDTPRHHGFCRRKWALKRDILKDKYGIEWRSPAIMNPRVRFD